MYKHMIVKNKKTDEDRAFWAHCETVAAEVSLWPAWMRGEAEIPPSPPSPGLSDNNYQFLPEAVKKAAVINARVALALHRFQLCVNDIRFG
jgi:hypothetical protein